MGLAWSSLSKTPTRSTLAHTTAGRSNQPLGNYPICNPPPNPASESHHIVNYTTSSVIRNITYYQPVTCLTLPYQTFVSTMALQASDTSTVYVTNFTIFFAPILREKLVDRISPQTSLVDSSSGSDPSSSSKIENEDHSTSDEDRLQVHENGKKLPTLCSPEQCMPFSEAKIPTPCRCHSKNIIPS